MMKFEKSILIDRPQQEVFDYVLDLNNDPKWQGSIESAEQTSPGANGAGAIWSFKVKFLGRKIDTDTEIISFDRPNGASVKSISGPVPFENTYKFESKNGGTLLSLNGQAELGRTFKLAEGLVAKQSAKQMDADLNALKLLIEAEEVVAA